MNASVPTIRERRGLAEWVLLYQAYNAIFKIQEQTLQPYGVTLPQLYVMALLAWAGRPLTVTQISGAMVREPHSIVLVVDRLEAAGLVTRGTDTSDRRQKPIWFTERGAAVFEEAFAASSILGEHLFAAVDNVTLGQLREATTKLRDAALAALGLTEPDLPRVRPEE